MKLPVRFFLAWTASMSCFFPAFTQSKLSLKSRPPGTRPPMEVFVSNLLDKMTLDEKIGQLNLPVAGSVKTGIAVNTDLEKKIKEGSIGGIFGVWNVKNIKAVQEVAVKESRLHIPLIFGLDVIHGHKTIFPIPLGMSSSWDTSLVEASARVAAKEASAEGLNWVFSPMVDIARDPRWGRVAEGSGEDPYLGGLMAQAMVRGYQGENLSNESSVMACVKHFALYGGSEAGREYNTVDMSRIRMYQEYLPPYLAAVKAGAGSFMSSFNTVDGIPASANKWLLTDLLRKQWGFKGFVVSDYTAVNEMVNHGIGDLQQVSAKALKAGLDMDMVGEGFLRTLKKSLVEKKIRIEDINQACKRILEAKYKLGLFSNPYKNCDSLRELRDVFNSSNLTLAKKMAMHSMVLLKNNQEALPIIPKGTIAVIGPLADDKHDMLGTWTIAGETSKAISVLEGINQAVGNQARVIYAKGSNITDDPELIKNLNFTGTNFVQKDSRSNEEMIAEAVQVAAHSDVVLACLGEAESMTGEASSRSNIQIPPNQIVLLDALVKTGKKVILVLFNGRPLDITAVEPKVPAILDVWAPGTEAGAAIAGVLFNEYNPSGKLSMTFPRDVGQIPIYYNHKNTGRPYSGIGPKKFKSDYLDISNDPLYPFGYGLSYTSFSYSPISFNKTNLKGNEVLKASITLTNTGKFSGEETVQLYIGQHSASISRAVKELKKFQKVSLDPGQSKKVVFDVPVEDLKFYNSELQYEWEPGQFNIEIGTNSRDTQSGTVIWNK